MSHLQEPQDGPATHGGARGAQGADRSRIEWRLCRLQQGELLRLRSRLTRPASGPYWGTRAICTMPTIPTTMFANQAASQAGIRPA